MAVVTRLSSEPQGTFSIYIWLRKSVGKGLINAASLFLTALAPVEHGHDRA